jgi:hypothetical protein
MLFLDKSLLKKYTFEKYPFSQIPTIFTFRTEVTTFGYSLSKTESPAKNE